MAAATSDLGGWSVGVFDTSGSWESSFDSYMRWSFSSDVCEVGGPQSRVFSYSSSDGDGVYSSLETPFPSSVSL